MEKENGNDPNNNFNITIILFLILIIILTDSLEIFLNIGKIIVVITVIFYILNYLNPMVGNKIKIITNNLINCLTQPEIISEKQLSTNTQSSKPLEESKSYINLNESNIRNLNGKLTNSNRNLAVS